MYGNMDDTINDVIFRIELKYPVSDKRRSFKAFHPAKTLVGITFFFRVKLLSKFAFEKLKPKIMRFLFLLLLTATTVLAQAQQINGLAKDEKGAPLNGATVSLVTATDCCTITLAL